MKNRRNVAIFTRLRVIRFLVFCIWMIAAAFVAWGEHYIIASLVCFGAIVVDGKCHVCPHCKAHLDTRMSLYEGVHCPSCGKVINWEYD